MKRIFKMMALLLCLTATAGMIGCSKDDNDGPSGEANPMVDTQWTWFQGDGATYFWPIHIYGCAWDGGHDIGLYLDFTSGNTVKMSVCNAYGSRSNTVSGSYSVSGNKITFSGLKIDGKFHHYSNSEAILKLTIQPKTATINGSTMSVDIYTFEQEDYWWYDDDGYSHHADKIWDNETKSLKFTKK